MTGKLNKLLVGLALVGALLSARWGSAEAVAPSASDHANCVGQAVSFAAPIARPVGLKEISVAARAGHFGKDAVGPAARTNDCAPFLPPN